MIGQTLGPYHITAEVATGGQATLYKAIHEMLGRETALKVLHPHLITVADFRQKFESESRILARLRHPNIVVVYDAGVDRGLYYIAMEWLDGQSVDELIEQQRKLSMDQAMRIADQVAAALEYAHAQGVIHRDIKPGNIMLLSDGTVKVLDFGIAAMVAAGQKAKTRIGTVEYMPLEQFRGQAEEDQIDVQVACPSFQIARVHGFGSREGLRRDGGIEGQRVEADHLHCLGEEGPRDRRLPRHALGSGDAQVHLLALLALEPGEGRLRRHPDADGDAGQQEDGPVQLPLPQPAPDLQRHPDLNPVAPSPPHEGEQGAQASCSG